MKKLIVTLVFALLNATAFATPSPKQVEQALMANDAVSARSMTQEVLREHPNSAKGHLFNAYILEHFDHNKVAAAEELKNVIRFDNKGDVKGSALFGKVVAELETASVQPQPRLQIPSVQKQYSAQQPTQNNNRFLVYTLILIGGIALAGVYVVHRSEQKIREQVRIERVPVYMNNSRSDPESSVYVQPVPINGRYDAIPQVFHQPVVVQAAPQQSLGALGTAASVAGGVVAGNAISDMLHSGRHHSHDNHYDGNGDRYERQYNVRQDSYVAPAPAYEAPAVDYETRSSSFSSGSSNSWGSDSYSSSSSSSDSSSSWGDSSSSSSSDW